MTHLSYTQNEPEETDLDTSLCYNQEECTAKLLAQCGSRDSPLAIGGDGRTDSPGHSAKCRSYGIIDSSMNKVLYIELIQINYIAIHEITRQYSNKVQSSI